MPGSIASEKYGTDRVVHVGGGQHPLRGVLARST